MKHDFWHSRWEEGRIGFHRQDFHPSLSRFWDSLKVARPGRVFVPLCGKSRDMMWLAGQGYAVLGSELSERACRSYFAEAELACSEDRQGAFIHFQSAETDILCGDFFALSADQLAGVAAVYDRAALIALPAMMRQQYADVLCALCSVLCALCSVLCALCSVLCALCSVLCALCSVLCALCSVLCALCSVLCALLPQGVQILLVTLEFEGEQGPPFAVFQPEVERLFERRFRTERLGTLLLDDPRDKGRVEVVYRLSDRVT